MISPRPQQPKSRVPEVASATHTSTPVREESFTQVCDQLRRNHLAYLLYSLLKNGGIGENFVRFEDAVSKLHSQSWRHHQNNKGSQPLCSHRFEFWDCQGSFQQLRGDKGIMAPTRALRLEFFDKGNNGESVIVVMTLSELRRFWQEYPSLPTYVQ